MQFELPERKQSWIEFLLIIVFAAIPLFATYPFRINIFLSWEGAYRMYLGQFPFKDFSIPMGYAYWVVPGIFFKLFGPFLSSLVKAQVFLNIISGIGFRSIFKSLGFKDGKRLLIVFLFVISYSFPNFWPWYNHTVIVYEIIGFAFLLISFNQLKKWKMVSFMSLAALFLFLSFFTKQDGGFFGVVIGFSIVCYDSLGKRSVKPLILFSALFIFVVFVFVAPLIQYDFLYWFNYGQPPHYSRINAYDIIDEFFKMSFFIKFYILTIGLIVLPKLKNLKDFFSDRIGFLHFLITAGVVVQAIVLQITSYTPPDGNIYFHSFCFAYILGNVSWRVNFSQMGNLSVGVLLLFLWWSGTYWKYVDRTVRRFFPDKKEMTQSDVISINTYKLEKDTTELDKSTWRLSEWKGFDRVYMPEETIEGIKRIKKMPYFNGEPKPKVLNMSELTPLAYELGFELEKGLPLWYHLNVGMFDRELKIFKDRIERKYYDVVLFEIVPNLNNFYPNEIRDSLEKNYRKVDVFQAPRRKTNEIIEVYQKD